MTSWLEKAVASGGLALMLLTSACTAPALPDTRAADEAAIREADVAWSKAAGSRNLEAVVSYYSDDAQVLPPNEPLAADRAAIRASWAALMAPEMAVSWKATRVEVARSGDFAYVTGTYLIEMKPANDTGKLVEVWKKQTGGQWKCVADIFNSDLPLPAAIPAVPGAKKK